MGRLLPADEALEFSVEYAAVVVFGTVRAVRDPEEKRRVLERIMTKYAPRLLPGRDYRPITDGELRRTAVHSLEIEAWSGKEKVAPRDFPGAHRLPAFEPPVLLEPPYEAGSER
jgi:nitroimidazol reductase NimA-like FMN-containing flavoprotein (pyridoxamine 5'-phosphate oxidase superfamily)